MVRLKKFGVLSVGTVLGSLYALMGLIFGAIVSLISFLSSSDAQGATSIVMGVGAIVFLPIIYGVMGFVFGVVSAAVYNLCAKWTGGMQVEIENVTPTSN